MNVEINGGQHKPDTCSKAEQGLGDISAVILAGGVGARLRSAVSDRPKIMAEVGNRPFITYLLDQLADAGIRYVVLCTGYLGDYVAAKLGSSYDSLRLVYSQEVSPLGTGGALRLAQPLFESLHILAMNGDSFCNTNLRDFWACHCARRAETTIVLTRTANTKRYGHVMIDKDNRIYRFIEKDEQDGQGWINAGVYLLSKNLLKAIPAKRKVSLEYEMFPAWIERGIYGFRSKAPFLDIGTPSSYNSAEKFFSRLHS